MFTLFAKRRQNRETARSLYDAIMTRSREPVFYRDCAVPDTLEGRFDMVILHAWLVMARLKRDERETKALSQALFDTMFRNIDINLREAGVGDLGVPKHIKRMAKGFYGRVARYEAALREDGDDYLVQALKHNLYGSETDAPEEAVAHMAAYVRRQAAHLATLPLDVFKRGEAGFAPAGIATEPAVKKAV